MEIFKLDGHRVVLEALEISHSEQLFNCSRSERLWEYLPIQVKTIEEMSEFVHSATENRKTGEEFPFVVIDKETNMIVGTTRYLRISENHKTLNIGWTWYSEDVWRTSINTEVKYLLLKHAFEAWGAVRVEIITTTNHERSQRAIERIGAVKEGVLRKKYNNKDYVCYSIIDDEWPMVKERIERLSTRRVQNEQ